MDQLLEVLKKANPNVDFTSSDKLIDDKVIDSIDMITIIGEIEDAFDIEIDVEDVVPENFNSVEAMWELIQELQ